MWWKNQKLSKNWPVHTWPCSAQGFSAILHWKSIRMRCEVKSLIYIRGKVDKNPFRHLIRYLSHKAWSSIDLWPSVQLEVCTYMSKQSVTLSLIFFFSFLTWNSSAFSQFILKQDCRFVADLMKIPEGIPELWCLPSIRLHWPLLPKIWMCSSLSQSSHL